MHDRWFFPSRRYRVAAILAGGLALALTRPAAAATVEWGHGCLPFIDGAEHYYKLPPGLLQAIALSESGQDGAPYPWALNIGGTAVTAGTYQQAAALLRYGDGAPRRDVAVGCMQIHMQYHLGSFGAPEWALHPRYNVWYAAGFLSQLHQRYGNWPAAVAHYHGSDPAAQQAYLCQVAGHLARTAPATGQALGLPACRSWPRPAFGQGQSGPARLRADAALRQNRRSILAARRVGRIIVLGVER